MPSRKNAPARNPRPAGIIAWTPSHIFCFCALTILTVATYANSLRGAFVFDDLQIVMQNSALMNVKTFGDVVLLAMREGSRKLLFFSYGLNYYWGGLQTFGYHVLNVVLHVVNVLLVYGIILEVLGEDKRARYVAFAGSAVFGVHTLLSGAVSYIAGRSSILCGTFYFGAIYLFFKGLNSDRREMRLVFFGLTAVSGWLSWEAKQEAITLPLFLAAVLLLRAGSKYWRWIPPLALIPLVTVLVLWNQIKVLYAVVGSNQVLVSAGFEKVLPLATYIRTYVASLVDYYFWRFLFPTQLSVDPLISPVEHWYSSEFLFSVSILGLLVWLTLRV